MSATISSETLEVLQLLREQIIGLSYAALAKGESGAPFRACQNLVQTQIDIGIGCKIPEDADA